MAVEGSPSNSVGSNLHNAGRGAKAIAVVFWNRNSEEKIIERYQTIFYHCALISSVFIGEILFKTIFGSVFFPGFMCEDCDISGESVFIFR